MSTLPISPDLKILFDNVTTGRQDETSTRAILVQSNNGTLQLVTTQPENNTDKEDFSPVLEKLFSSHPSTPGYALYRLDSKSPAGLYEWINCAYRPEGAKVREKMQYTATQASLFKALNEQHFLETVYGGSVNEFTFPTRLRNQRKHDYQNPQQSTAGKKAAEAAGTGTAGRRNFEKVSAPLSVPEKKSSAFSELPSVTSEEKSVAPSAEPEEVQSVSPTKAQTDPSPPSPPTLQQSDLQALPEEDTTQNIQETLETEAGIAGSPIDSDYIHIDKSEAEPEEVKNVEASVHDLAPLSAHDLAPLSALSALSKDSEKDEEIQDDIMQQSIAPSSFTELQKETIDQEPQQPVHTFIAEESRPETSTRENIDQASTTTSTGMGTSSQGSETERERHLAHLKSEEQKLKSTSSQGGSHIGFTWQDDVEPALHGLAKRLGGTSEWNLVVVKIDLAKEEIELASQPRFVPPGDFSEVLSDQEPCYAFYSHPAVQIDSEESSQVIVIYVCPLHSSVRQRMLYSANLATTLNRVSSIQGLSILKRIETSDPRELTAVFFAEELLGQSGTDAGQAKALSRPKRPGRK